MGEHLAKQARKIDFRQDSDQTVKEDTEMEAGEADSDMKSFQQPVWPWESVRNALRSALTEFCVASDVLSVSTKVLLS